MHGPLMLRGGGGAGGGAGGTGGGCGGEGGDDTALPVMRTASISSQPLTAVWILTCDTMRLPGRLTCSTEPHDCVSGPEKTTVLWPAGLIASTLVTNPAPAPLKISMDVASTGCVKPTSSHSGFAELDAGAQAVLREMHELDDKLGPVACDGLYE